jgi:hypothetical protein
VPASAEFVGEPDRESSRCGFKANSIKLESVHRSSPQSGGKNGLITIMGRSRGAFLGPSGISSSAHYVVELVGLEPSARLLWNAVMSDQLTLFEHQALEHEKGPLLMGIATRGEISVASRRHGKLMPRAGSDSNQQPDSLLSLDVKFTFPEQRTAIAETRLVRINIRQVQGFRVAAPIRLADHRGARPLSRAADAHRLRL